MYFISCVSLKLCFKDWSTLAAFWCDNWVRKTFPQYWVAQRSNAKLLSTFGSESYDTFPTTRHSFVQNAGSNKSPKHAIYKVSTCKWLEPRGATLLSLCPSLNCRCKKKQQRKHPRDDGSKRHSLTNSPSCSRDVWLGQWPEIFWWGLWGGGGKKEKAFIESRLFSLWQFAICLSFSLSENGKTCAMSRCDWWTHPRRKEPDSLAEGRRALCRLESWHFDNLWIKRSASTLQDLPSRQHVWCGEEVGVIRVRPECQLSWGTEGFWWTSPSLS